MSNYSTLSKIYDGVEKLNGKEAGHAVTMIVEHNVYCPFKSDHRVVSFEGKYHCRECQKWWHK